MKYLSLILLAVILSVGANAQKGDGKVDNPLAMHFGKKLTVTKHVKDGLNIPHKGDEYMLLKSEGAYFQNFPSNINGSWSYNGGTNEVSVKVGTNVTSMKVDESTKYIVKLSNGTESYELTPEGAPTATDSGTTVTPATPAKPGKKLTPKLKK